MASAQVLPSSSGASNKKQGHLELGRKKLEEFRKKKAEGRAKKTASVGQGQPAEMDQTAKVPQNIQIMEDEAKSDTNRINQTSGANTDSEAKIVNPSENFDNAYLDEGHSKPSILPQNNYAPLSEFRQENGRDDSSGSCGRSEISEVPNGYYDYQGYASRNRDQILENGSGETMEAYHPHPSTSSNRFPSVQVEKYFSGPYSSNTEQSAEISTSFSSSTAFTGRSDFDLASATTDVLSHNKRNTLGISNNSHTGDSNFQDLASGVEQYPSIKFNQSSDIKSDGGRSKIADSISRHLNLEGSSWRLSEPSSVDYRSGFKSSFSEQSLPSNLYGATPGRSRPSFLNSLGMPRVSSTPHVPFNEAENANSEVSNSQIEESRFLTSLQQDIQSKDHSFIAKMPEINTSELSMKSPVSTEDGQRHVQDLGNNHVQADSGFLGVKKDEDFATLEQHIEDLTQEKFALQRALETSRALAESLATENSSLTDSYNQQGELVSQLRSDLESLQEEIKAQLSELESLKMEYVNAKLECSAADERAKVLASEVISLEEKALRLRSNELKLEKQLEKLNSEISSYKRKVSSLEKERQDFQSTVDALREEKKLLQSKLRKASTDEKVTGTKTSVIYRKDEATSTEDLESVSSQSTNTQVAGPSGLLPLNSSSFPVLPEERGHDIPESTADIPHDQLRMIENIRSLISELAMEKEELMRKLTIESSNNSKLKELNKDLSQKLETQTQRLELLTAQHMAPANVALKPVDLPVASDALELADEGDEVVERVLSWIMKLFPGGPSKRRTSKLL